MAYCQPAAVITNDQSISLGKYEVKTVWEKFWTEVDVYNFFFFFFATKHLNSLREICESW